MAVIWMVLSTVGLVIVDQLTKFWATKILVPVGNLPFIPYIIEFQYLENRGAAFGIFQDSQVFLIILTSIALLVLSYFTFVKRRADIWETVAFVLFIAGGIGNLIDRIFNRFVVDFLNFLFIDFPVFNFADICVVVGFAILLFTFIRQEIEERKKKKNAKKIIDDSVEM